MSGGAQFWLGVLFGGLVVAVFCGRWIHAIRTQHAAELRQRDLDDTETQWALEQALAKNRALESARPFRLITTTGNDAS